MSLKARLQDDMHGAMRARDKPRLSAIRLIMAAVKQREVDERGELDDTAVLTVLEKMLKQRRESITQYEAAGRNDLVATEKAEVDVIRSYLPEPLSDSEIDALIASAIAETGAQSLRDMGRVVARVRGAAQGRADMAALSARIKARLGPQAG